MTSAVGFVELPGAIPFMLGWVGGYRRIWNRSRNFIFNSVFLAISHLAIGWFCMKIMKSRFSLCCPPVKKHMTSLQIILSSLV
jgi:hypothetical protein